MNAEIEKLIDFALADGLISDKEREIIRRKAEKLGEDPDEAEMILDAKLAMQNQDAVPSTPQSPPPVAAPPPTPPPAVPPPTQKQKSSKAGDIMTCPACGATANSMELSCGECGHEFRGVESATSINLLYDELQKIEEMERSRKRSFLEKIDGDMGVQKNIASRQASAISSFPVPNTKEDILEFLSIAYSEANKKLSLFINHAHPDAILKKAWKAKCEQLIIKARFSMKENDPRCKEVDSFAKGLNI